MTRFTEEQIDIRDMTRDFARQEITPFAAEWDRNASMPMETVRKAGEFGLFGVCMPAEWGGAGADFIADVLATEELARLTPAGGLHMARQRVASALS